VRALRPILFLLLCLGSLNGAGAQGWQQYGYGGALPSFYGMSAVNDSVCWFSGDLMLTILVQLHSNGNSYVWSQNGLEPGQFTAIAGRSSTLAYTASGNGKLFKTTDGGNNWTKQFTQANGAFIDGMYFWTDSVGIAFGDPVAYPGTGPFTLIRTTDGGTTWNDISSTLPSVTAEYGVCLQYDAVGSHFWFSSFSNLDTSAARFLFHSSDRGLTWEKLSVPQFFGDFTASFSDTSNGLITGNSGKIARTTDGGKTWTYRHDGVGILPLKMEKGTSNVWIQGYYDENAGNNPVFYSTDFGSTWGRQPRNSPVNVNGFSVTSHNVVWASGYNYLVLRNSTASVVTSVSSQSRGTAIPQSMELSQNYPNPFNPTTMIKYNIRNAGQTKLTVYDVLGREVRTLVDGAQSSGWHIITWDGTNDNRQGVSTGTYFYRIENNGQIETKKMIMLK